MIRRKSGLGLCLAALPLVWGLSGCGGGGAPKSPPPAPPVVKEDTTPAKKPAAETKKPEGEKKEAAAAPAAGTEAWGSIKGQVVYGGDKVPEAAVLVKKGDKDAKDAQVCAVQDVVSEELVVNKDNKGLKWAVVYIGGKPKVHPDLKHAQGSAELGQKFCAFKPHVLAMRQGQKFIISSEDPVAHNTNGQPFKNPPFNPVVSPAPKDGKSELPGPNLVAEPRPIKIGCNIHSWMTAWLCVFDHPYYAVTDENGNFEIKNVPAGTQNLVVWQEKLLYGEGKAKGKEITVKAGEVTDLGKIVLK